MKRSDLILLLGIAVVLAPFFVFPEVYKFYTSFNHDHFLITSFIKFSVLATLGEMIGLRIKTGRYHMKGFGVIPRMIVWGFLGVTIKIAFVVFATGTPALLEMLGIEDAARLMNEGFSFGKLLVAFCISLLMNIFYAPVMMTFHRITDMHILQNGGTILGFFRPIKFRKLFVDLDWKVQWNFVFKKTIPFFWIPMHTITFLLPSDYRVLFAAFLGIALGTILAIADIMGDNNE